MRWVVFGSGVLLALVALLGAGRAGEGWVALFDGRTLDGWVQRNGTAEYRVEDGAIVGCTSEGSPNSFLTTEQTYGDFELEFEVRVDDALNSGVQIRSRTRERSTGEGPDDRAGRVFGPQVEIEASPGLAGYVYGEATGRGWLTPAARRVPHAHFRNGQWNRYRIVAKGPRIRTWVNGEPIEDLTDEDIYRTHPEGFIGLQVHAIEPGRARTRSPGATCACARCRARNDPPAAHRHCGAHGQNGRPGVRDQAKKVLMIRARTPAMTMPFIHFSRSIWALMTASSLSSRAMSSRVRSIWSRIFGSRPVSSSIRSNRSDPMTRLSAAARAFSSEAPASFSASYSSTSIVLICDLRIDMMSIETASIKHSARGAALFDACAQ